MICYIHVPIFIAVIDASVTAMHLGTFWHIDAESSFSRNFPLINGQVGWRCKLLRVVDGGDKVFAELFNSAWINPLNCSIIMNTEKHRPTVTIQEGAHRFIYITIELIATGLEFDLKSFAYCYQCSNLVPWVVRSVNCGST